MKSMFGLGLLLLVFGVLALAYEGLAYNSAQAELGAGLPASGNPPIAVEQDPLKAKSIPIHPLLSALLVASGLSLIVVGRIE